MGTPAATDRACHSLAALPKDLPQLINDSLVYILHAIVAVRGRKAPRGLTAAYAEGGDEMRCDSITATGS